MQHARTHAHVRTRTRTRAWARTHHVVAAVHHVAPPDLLDVVLHLHTQWAIVIEAGKPCVVAHKERKEGAGEKGRGGGGGRQRATRAHSTSAHRCMR